MTLRIEPVMALGTEPVPGAGSLWVGQLEIAHPLPDHLELTDAPGFDRARLLLRYRGTPVVFAEVAVSGMRVRTSDLLAALPEHGRLGAAPDSGPGSADSGDIAVLPSISVVLCTRDRPDALRTALTSIARLRYPELEVVVVDNAASTRATHELVAALDDQRFRVVDAPVPGLARARNVGLLAARHEVVAFTDDDVVVDPSWLEGIARGFGVGVGVACVCGMVPSGELSTSAQLFFDRRVAWASSLTREVFSLADPRPGDPLFPFHVGRYGTGANFALRRETALRLGGFDEALGAGSPTGGGEDTDMFLRVLLAGKHLVYEPSALVWHRHRADVEPDRAAAGLRDRHGCLPDQPGVRAADCADVGPSAATRDPPCRRDDPGRRSAWLERPRPCPVAPHRAVRAGTRTLGAAAGPPCWGPASPAARRPAGRRPHPAHRPSSGGDPVTSITIPAPRDPAGGCCP